MTKIARGVRVVAALITTDEGRRVLVQQRPLGRLRPLLWEFPGGKVETDETDVVALRREAGEELGVDLDVGSHCFQCACGYPDIDVELHFYRARITSGTPRPLNGQLLREVAWDELSNLSFCEADRPFVEALVKAASEGSGRLPE